MTKFREYFPYGMFSNSINIQFKQFGVAELNTFYVSVQSSKPDWVV